MTAKKKYYYLFTSILFFNILGILFDTFFSQKLWDKILFKTVKHHIFFDSAFFEFFYFHFFYLCLLGIFFSLLLLIVTSLLPDSEQSEQIAAEKADQMYYEEMFSQPKMNLLARNPFIIIPAYDKRFIGMHPDLKEYFVRKVPGKEIFSTELNIDFADGTWQLSVDERTTELVKAQFSKDGKFVLVSGMKEGNSIINISREDEIYGGSILVRVEEPEEWYEKLQEEIKLETVENKK